MPLIYVVVNSVLCRLHLGIRLLVRGEIKQLADFTLEGIGRKLQWVLLGRERYYKQTNKYFMHLPRVKYIITGNPVVYIMALTDV